MYSGIVGIGTSLPSHKISQADLCSHAKKCCCENSKQVRVIESIYKRSEIKQRSVVVGSDATNLIDEEFYPPRFLQSDLGPTTAERMLAYNVEVVPLAQNACHQALLDAAVDAAAITHLVTASCTGFAAPGFDLKLIDALSINRSVSRTHIGFMGCHAALNALRVAHAFCSADARAKVMVCAAEICSVHFQYGWSSQALVSNSLFADGAGAVVLARSDSHPQYASARSLVLPDTADAMTWQIGDNGFRMQLSAVVPDLIEEHLDGFIESFLSEDKLTKADINGWGVHPGGPRILDAVQNALSVDASQLSVSHDLLAECGNMSSPTVIFILQRLLATGRSLPYVLLGFGPGLTIEAALIR